MADAVWIRAWVWISTWIFTSNLNWMLMRKFSFAMHVFVRKDVNLDVELNLDMDVDCDLGMDMDIDVDFDMGVELHRDTCKEFSIA